ncbi:hypothetical protein FCIRC_3141 [Fusarium circinatum]|uniref:Uncharacterized protein n=1 Tax=Fusarium circinatum TaxID=48490 RepID=A0A8H5X924_FUSCI|nr:hypothetical protein FCIRC_3141 [Fusarium circinatum]
MVHKPWFAIALRPRGVPCRVPGDPRPPNPVSFTTINKARSNRFAVTFIPSFIFLFFFLRLQTKSLLRLTPEARTRNASPIYCRVAATSRQTEAIPSQQRTLSCADESSFPTESMMRLIWTRRCIQGGETGEMGVTGVSMALVVQGQQPLPSIIVNTRARSVSCPSKVHYKVQVTRQRTRENSLRPSARRGATPTPTPAQYVPVTDQSWRFPGGREAKGDFLFCVARKEMDRRRDSQPNPTYISEERFPIEEFLDWRIIDGDSVVIKVRWADGSPDTEEPEEIMHIDSPQTLLNFWRRHGGRGPATDLQEHRILRVLKSKESKKDNMTVTPLGCLAMVGV